MTANDDKARRARVVRNAILLALTAFVVYGAFIYVQYQRSKVGM